LSWGLASPCQVEVIRIVLLLSLVAIKIRAASSHLELSILRSMSTPGHANKDLQTEIEEWKRRTSMWKSRIHCRMLEPVAVPMFLLLLIALNIASSGFEVCCLARRVDSLSTPVEVQASLWRHPCVVDIQRDHESVVCRLTTLKEAILCGYSSSEEHEYYANKSLPHRFSPVAASLENILGNGTFKVSSFYTSKHNKDDDAVSFHGIRSWVHDLVIDFIGIIPSRLISEISTGILALFLLNYGIAFVGLSVLYRIMTSKQVESFNA